MIRSDKIFRRDAKGKLRYWYYEIDGAKWRGVGALIDGKATASKWTIAKPKNVGKKNETLPEEQAYLEAEAEFFKKIAREYRRTVDELDNVPPSPMLARDYEDETKHIEKAFASGEVVYTQPKLDGIRSLVNGRGATSREYQPHRNVEHITDALAPVIAKYPYVTFDGELYNHVLKHDFNTISSVVRTQNVTEEDRARAKKLIEFHIYDCMTGDDRPFFDRWALLTEISAQFDLLPLDGPIKFVCTGTAHSAADLDLHYANFLDQGYEGQMVRINGRYEADTRSKFLLKRKEWVTGEFELVDIQEGTGNWSGVAKAIRYKLPDGREVGAGLRGDEAFAKKLLDEKDKYLGPGAQVTIEYFKVLTPDGKHRFARAIDFHPNGRRD